MYLHEPSAVAGPELSPDVLAGWRANFTAVVEYARAAFPGAKVWLTHTTLPPAHHAASGAMLRPYLGRRYYVEQLNGAACAAAMNVAPPRMQLVDYDAVGQRWVDGQAHLEDAIHPGRVVGLEIANVILNLAAQAVGSDGSTGGAR